MTYPEIPQVSLLIPKMALKQTAMVEILRTDSPSSLFVRPVNHIRDELIFKEPFALTRDLKYKKGDFVLAPIEERCIGRCQVLEKFETHAKVFFVDDAITSYVDNSCIFKIFSAQCHNPCQVLHISLARCRSVENLSGVWTTEQCAKFRELLDEFVIRQFEISTVEYDLDTTEDRPILMAELFGFIDKERVHIEEMFAAFCPGVIVNMLPDEIGGISDFANKGEIDKDFVIDEIRRKLPEDWIGEIKDSKEEEENDWAMDQLQVIEFDLELLEENGYLNEEGCLVGYMEAGTVVSPSDMFIRPIRSRRKNGEDEKSYMDLKDQDNWLVEDFDELMSYSQIVDIFYRHPENQKQLNYEEISSHFERNAKIYAMVTSTNKRTHVEGQWKRVEILSARVETAEVRYLDFGGIAHVKMKQMYKMHKSHTHQLPFCIPMKIENIQEVLDSGEKPAFMICLDEERMLYAKSRKPWSVDICQTWSELVPIDVPVVIGPNIEFDEIGKLVFSVIRVLGSPDNKSLVDVLADEFEGRVVFGIEPVSSSVGSSVRTCASSCESEE